MNLLNKKFMSFMEKNKSYKVGDILFVYEDTLEKISVYNVLSGKFLCTIGSSEDLFTSLSFRVCSRCGRPIASGYTDGFDYYHDYEEFTHMLNLTYGLNNWRSATQEESSNYSVSYMYRIGQTWYPDISAGKWDKDAVIEYTGTSMVEMKEFSNLFSSSISSVVNNLNLFFKSVFGANKLNGGI